MPEMIWRDIEDGTAWCKRCWTEDEDWLREEPAKAGDYCEDCDEVFDGTKWRRS